MDRHVPIRLTRVDEYGGVVTKLSYVRIAVNEMLPVGDHVRILHYLNYVDGVVVRHYHEDVWTVSEILPEPQKAIHSFITVKTCQRART